MDGRLTWHADEEVGLVLLARAGDLRAFDRLVRHYRPALTALARQIVDPEQAHDVAQEALIAAYKSLPQLRDVGRFGTWLSAIARHRARRIAGEGSPLRLDEVIAAHLPALAEPESVVAEAVRCALRSLPGEVAVIADLYYLQEWSIAEIGAFLELPATTVKWRLHSARSSLRPRLEHLMEKQL